MINLWKEKNTLIWIFDSLFVINCIYVLFCIWKYKMKLKKLNLKGISLTKIKNLWQKREIASSRPFIDDVKSIFRAYKWQIIWISILSGFLLFLLNILVGVSMYGSTINDGLKDKLWMYFYLKDDVESEWQLYKQVLKLKDNLEKEWLQVTFLTKEDAMDFMMKRLPELTWSLEKFWINNPLPATLYVTFSDKSQYSVLQNVMLDNKDIILNVQDLNQLENLEQQESRIINIIKLSNFVQILAISLVVVIAVVILSFSIFFLKTIFSTFWQDIQVKKLLWANKLQIIMPFLWLIFYAIIGWFLLSLVLTLSSLWVFDYYMAQLLWMTLTSSLFSNWWSILLLFVLEIMLIVSLLMGISYVFVSKLHKKLK